jgi:NADH:ubiquinone reductase (H+-translocating)
MNTGRIVIVGAGFAGVWSALGAARVLDAAGKSDAAEIVSIAPEPFLHMRPRFYEADVAQMKAPLTELFAAAGVRFVAGHVQHIRTGRNEVDVVGADGAIGTLAYDKLVLATGSRLFMPPVAGLREHAFSVDQLDDAAVLETHLWGLRRFADSAARNTVVVAGGGFTGIETAAEMPARLRLILGEKTAVRVIVVEQADAIGPDLGAGPRPVITQALEALGVEMRLNAAVTAIDADGLTTSTGERIDAKTVIWTAGLRASDLTQQIPGTRDRLGRLHVDRDLRVEGVADVFATGDVAYAVTDEEGHHALMSCQHALRLGRFAGHNVAADLLGLPLRAYTQPRYTTCLDLGPWGAVLTQGWDRGVKLTGAEAKAVKQMINGKLIYPPRADRREALAAADPDAMNA